MHRFHQIINGSHTPKEARHPFKQYHSKALCHPIFLSGSIGSSEFKEARQQISVIASVCYGYAHFTQQLSHDF